MIKRICITLLMCSLTLASSTQAVLAKNGAVSDSLTTIPTSSCSTNAENFFFLAPYSPRTDTSDEGGMVIEVAQDGFTAIGLSYHTENLYQSDLSEWLATDLCMIYRLWPTRTVYNPFSPKYHGAVGSLVRHDHEKKFVCYETMPSIKPIFPQSQLTAYPDDDSPTLCSDLEIADASDEQMDIWVEQIEQMILDAVNDPVLNSRIVAWYLGPEELYPNIPREKELLQRLYASVKKFDPLQRPAWMYSPQHKDVDHLVQLGPWMDALSMGIYPNLSHNLQRRIQVRHALHQMTEANALLGYSKKGFTKRILPVMEMFEDPVKPYSDTLTGLIPEFVRHDAYTAFANGADGLLIWSMGYRPGFETYSTYYDAWVEIAQEMSTLGIRDVIQQGQVQNGVLATITDGEATIDFNWLDFQESYPSLSIREWLFAGRTYVLLVNSSEDEIGFVLDNLPPAVYTDLFSNEMHDAEYGYLELSLPPLGVMLLVTQPSYSIGPNDFTAERRI